MRIVEMNDEPSQQSRALAVNSRTLKILEPTSLTTTMLELALPIPEARFYEHGRVGATPLLRGILPDYPSLPALPQAATERLLTDALEALERSVERETVVGRRTS